MTYERDWYGITPAADGRFLVQNLKTGRTIKSYAKFGDAVRLRDRLASAEAENVQAATKPARFTPLKEIQRKYRIAHPQKGGEG